MSPVQCPLLAAIIPVRYAIGCEEFASDFLAGLPLPELNGRCISESVARDEQALAYVARPLRDGWCYVWLGAQQRLVEYQVARGALDETPRGGTVIMPGGGPYLFLPAGEMAMLAWSPVRWSDAHYTALQGNASQRDALMRPITP